MAGRPDETTSDITSIKRAQAYVPSGDVTDLVSPSRALYVGVTGDVTVIFVADKDDDEVTLVGLAAGIWHPIQVRRILQTGTDATDIVVGY
jgi:hypothetical protein